MKGIKTAFTAILMFASTIQLSAEITFVTSQPAPLSHIQERMNGHLETIKNILDAGYAPAVWKEKHFGWNLDKEIEVAKKRVAETKDIDVKEFQKIVNDFFMSMHDHHVSARFHSTERASLPFFVKGANNRYFITYINENMLSPSFYNINVGDEIVTFDGKPIHEVILKLQQDEMLTVDEGTDRSLAELFLTHRIGAFAHHVPQGSVMIGVKKGFSEKVHNYQLPWDYEPELITNHYKIYDEKEDKALEDKFFNPMMMSGYNDFFESLPIDESISGHKPGTRKSFLPDLGKVLWSTSKKKRFHAYLFENDEGRLIGYVRIPHYSGSTKEVLEFAEIINFFEERSELLVVDQVNNPGGSIFFMCALAGLLTDQPLEVPKHQIAITQHDVADAIEHIPVFENVFNDDDAIEVLGENFVGHPVTHQMAKFFLNYFRFVLNEWNAGKSLTAPTHLYGFDHINPMPHGSYTKPILILVNELSISCGDFFPAIMQDNKRATVMGTRTSGAGGFVLRASFPNLFGLNMFRYTGSIASRIDKNPIENLGVTPDIFYQIKDVDLQDSYSSYIEEINQVISQILEKETN